MAYEHIARNMGNAPAATEIDTLKHDTFFGREKENLVFPIALANLVLHGIDQPNLWHGNTLTKRATYSALFDKAPKIFDVIRQLNQDGMAVLLVEQNARMALKLAHRGYVMETGVITISGPAADLLNDQRVKDAYLGD